jgi:multimeric flavodoxin WrbA
MTAHPGGRKLGVHVIPAPDELKAQGIKVLGISGSARQKAGMSNSERILLQALDMAKKFAAVPRFIRLQDLKIYDCEGHYSQDPGYCTYPCQNSMKYEDDQMQIIYDAILDTDILILATPIRWNNHSALMQKFIERMNCIENSDVWFGKKLIKDKIAGLIVIGHVDGVQHVAGNLMNFLNWLGFHMPQDMITSWVGPNDEDTTKDGMRYKKIHTPKKIWRIWSMVFLNLQLISKTAKRSENNFAGQIF